MRCTSEHGCTHPGELHCGIRNRRETTGWWWIGWPPLSLCRFETCTAKNVSVSVGAQADASDSYRVAWIASKQGLPPNASARTRTGGWGEEKTPSVPTTHTPHAVEILAQSEFHQQTKELLATVYEYALRTEICLSEARDLQTFLMHANITRMDTLSEFDGPRLIHAVRAMVESEGWDYDRCTRTHRVLQLARMHPSLDHDGSFARVFRTVPFACTTAHPHRAWVADLPSNLLAFIESRKDTMDAEHLYGIVACMLQDRLVTNVGRERSRVVASCAASLLRVVRVIERLEPGACLRDWLPRTATPSHLVEVTARMMAFLNRSVAGRSQSTTHRIRTQAEVVLQHMLLLVRCGVFEPHTPIGATLPMRRLHARMFYWENTVPERYAATPGPRALASKPELTHETLARLLEVAQTREEVAYLQLSATTGLRAGAVARLRLSAVWDASRNEVAPVICAMEKNSDVRRISTAAFPALREALHAYIISNERGGAVGVGMGG